MKLSEKLIELRKQKGWSQEEFAEKLDVSRQVVSRWENETALPDAQNILRISKLFQVTADYLLNDHCDNEGELPALTSETEATDALPAKKRYPRPLYVVCFTVIVAVAFAAIGTAIGAYIASTGSRHKHSALRTVMENEVAPTCTAEGSYDEVVYCTECNEEVLRTHKSTKKSAHTLSSSVKEKEITPTCTEDGSYCEVVYCTVCDKKVLQTQRTTEKTGHQFQDRQCVVCNEYQPSEGLLYMSNGDGTCVVAVGSCTDEAIAIPSQSPDGDTVVQIKPYAFMTCRWVKRIQIPETVTVIGDGAFQDCDALEYVNLPSGITTIAPYTFDGCKNLKEITLPAGVTHIGREAFADCRACESIVIPAGVCEIGRFAFRSFSSGAGSITFEVYGAWELYDADGNWYHFVDFREERFEAVTYLTYRFTDCVWIRA